MRARPGALVSTRKNMSANQNHPWRHPRAQFDASSLCAENATQSTPADEHSPLDGHAHARHTVRPAPAAEPVLASASPPASDTRARILVVEDERLIRVSLRHELQELGYDVSVAACAVEAMPVVRERGDFDLLLSDVILPGMSGPELAREIRKAVPRCKILFMSALPAEMLVHDGRIEPDQAVLQKPFGESELAAKVHAMLHDGAE
jgi:two-component system cell cycle sensor histidine kinase/response regulator CckA